jgi:hypothetical protein
MQDQEDASIELQNLVVLESLFLPDDKDSVCRENLASVFG